MLHGVRTRVRGGVINTLDILPANGNSWLTSLDTAEIPKLRWPLPAGSQSEKA